MNIYYIWSWLKDPLFLVPAGILTALVATLVMLIRSETQAEAYFMQECMQDHKEYECTAMWREGSSRVVPIVIPVHVR